VDHATTFGKAMMLSIAYSASIGGISTLIGTPPNLVLAGVLEEIFDIEISFAMWMKLGLPVSIILLFICWNYLTKLAFRFENQSFPGGVEEIRNQKNALGSMKYEEKRVMFIFALMAGLWIFRPLIQRVIPGIDDTVIAIFAAVIIFLFPSSVKGQRLITWEEAVRIPWGIILLFGGGMALAEGFKSSGLALWIGQQLTLFEGLSLILIVLFLVAMVNFLTEVTSNLATTAMILPVLAPLAQTLDVHPYTLMVAATLAASCAFLLPVATPPNAVVFGSGYLRVPDMARTGIWMNLISILIITLMVYYLMPVVWGIDISVFPATLEPG
jgi:sodium-dependent dicarboxylate transporter 2/3/5